MPDSAIQFARETDWSGPPPEFHTLLADVRTRYEHQLAVLHHALDKRLGEPQPDCLDCFRAATEMAVMAEVGAHTLTPADRHRLRELWTALLHA
ncbi:hypothetical protein [Nocardia sp. NBC_00511]|uniref:hypothetical protein n=1 Tax=Nocardia sp. NBC_00511 TaxID=2903591 RepID=UPI0030E2DBCA